MNVSSGIIIFLGPPGSGKGTQAARLGSLLQVPAISTGDLLRRECESRSELGCVIGKVLTAGQLVADDLINQIVAARLDEPDTANGCILDGYPRTLQQARFIRQLLERKGLPVPLVIDLYVDLDDVLMRLSRRRQCAHCGKIVSLDGSAAGRSLTCDVDGGLLTERDDDRPAVIRERLEIYNRHAEPLVQFYRQGNYHRIAASRPAAEVTDSLLQLLNTESSVQSRAHPVQTFAAASFA